jgi:copper(I)-binding protein
MQKAGFTRILFGIAAFAVAASALAEGTLQIRNARAIATVPGQRVAAAYMTISSPSAARIVSAKSDAAESVQFHVMSMQNGIMRMRRLDVLDLPAGREIRLAPGGTHLMLAGLNHPLRAGGAVELSLAVVGADGEMRVVRLNLPVVDARLGQAGHHD